jgi:hypothetical protein
MTIDEAKQKKKDLEDAICDLCSQFEKETSLSIDEISLFKIGHGLTEAETTHVNITVKL